MYSNTGFPDDFPDELAGTYSEIGDLVGIRVVSDDIYNPDREYGHLGNSSIYSQILVVNPSTFFNVLDMSMSEDTGGDPEHLLQDERTCVISKTLARSIHLEIGDDLGIKTTDEVYDEEYKIYKDVVEMHKLQIVGMIDDPNLGFLWFGGRPFDEIVITSFDSMEDLHEKDIDPPDLEIMNLILIKVASGYRNAIQSLKEKILGKYGEEYNLNIYTREDLVSMVRGNIDNIFNIFYMALGFSLIVAAVGMANIMTISVSEREWEIYVLRALGASRRQVSFSFYAESFALSMIGLAVGLSTGLFFWSRLSSSFLSQGGSILSILPIQAIEWSFYAVVGVTLLSGTYPAWKASQILPVGRIIGAPRKKRRGKSTKKRLDLGSVKRRFGLSKIIPDLSLPRRSSPARERDEDLDQIARRLKQELGLTSPSSLTSIPVSKSALSKDEAEVEKRRPKISSRLAKQLRRLPEDSGVLSFLVPDESISAIADSILEWLPEGTRVVEATTRDVRANSGEFLNSVVILCYSPLSQDVASFLADVERGCFRVVLVPSSTFNRLSGASRSKVDWALEEHIEQRSISRRD